MADDQFDAPSRTYRTRTSQQRPENRPESYEDQEHGISEGRFKFVNRAKGATNEIRNASAPDVMNPTGAVLGLVGLNFMWTIWRGTVNNPRHLLPTISKSIAGLWFVTLGVLLVAQFNPRLAVMFMILVTVGNVLQDGASNRKAIDILNNVFTKKG